MFFHKTQISDTDRENKKIKLKVIQNVIYTLN